MKHLFNDIVTKSFDAIEPSLTPMANFFGHSKSHIRMDGSSYRSKGIKALMEKDGFRTAVPATIALVGFQISPLGIGDSLSWQMIEYAGITLGIATACVCLLEMADVFNGTKDDNIIIDRSGDRSNMVDFSSTAIDAMHTMRNKGLQTIPILVAGGIFHANYGTEPVANTITQEMAFIPFSVLMMRSISQAYRNQMLINGHTSNKKGYVVSDTPPVYTTDTKPLKNLQPSIST